MVREKAATMIKRVPERKHIAKAAKYEAPRLLIPAAILVATWTISILLFPH
jgi:hypothetical protein